MIGYELSRTERRRIKIYEKYGGHCGYCGNKISLSEMRIDHMRPVSQGGSNELSNLLPSCYGCDRIKGMRTVGQFRINQVDKKHGGLLIDGLFFFERKLK